MCRIQNKVAFTLLETIIVFMLVSSISLLTFPLVSRVYEDFQTELAVAQIKEELILSRQYAQMSGQDVACHINLEQGTVSSSVPNTQTIRLPLFLKGNSTTFIFTGKTGCLKQFRQFQVMNERFLYTGRMQFGKGVFIIEKSAR